MMRVSYPLPVAHPSSLVSGGWRAKKIICFPTELNLNNNGRSVRMGIFVPGNRRKFVLQSNLNMNRETQSSGLYKDQIKNDQADVCQREKERVR